MCRFGFLRKHTKNRGKGVAGDGPKARPLSQLEPHFLASLHDILTRKFGQRLSIACNVDFVLFKSLYVTLAFIATFKKKYFHHSSHYKLSPKTASEDCMLFFFKF